MKTNIATRQIDVEDAKTQFSRIILAVARGEEIILTKNGKPMAKLVAASTVPQERPA
jgi:prevent-host-death family protein